MTSHSMTSEQAVLVKLGIQYKQACLDPFLTEDCLDFIDSIAEALMSDGSSEISEPYSRESASKIQQWIRLQKEEIADGCGVWNIMFAENAEKTADETLKADAASEKTAGKIAAVLDGYESQTGLCVLYETIRSFSLGEDDMRKIFSDRQINVAAERLAVQGWTDEQFANLA